MNAVHQRSSARDRFFAAVNKNGPVHPVHGRCWVWTKSGTHKCGGIRHGGKRHLAHRFSWVLHRGPLSEGDCVLHKCDNPTCVNPSHLFKGSQLENIRDRDEKLRQARGRCNGRSKLTEEDVRVIRSVYRPRCPVNGNKALAKRFGVRPLAVCWVVSGKTWGHVK